MALRSYLFLLTILVVCADSGRANAQDDSPDLYFQYPHITADQNFSHAFSIHTARLPEDMIEEASNWVRAPLFDYEAAYVFADDFQLSGAIQSNIITWQFSAGVHWVKSFNRFSLSVGIKTAYFFGNLNHFGFKSKVTGWINSPQVTLGYRFPGFALSIKSEADFLSVMDQFADNIEINSEHSVFNGIAFSFFIEQPLWKDNIVFIGGRANYLKYYIPAWAVFPTFDRYFWIPEFVVGIVL